MRRSGLVSSLLCLCVILAPTSSAHALANTWAGTWQTTFGTMTLDAAGNGTYSYCSGTLTGASISGNTLSGTWTENRSGGCGGSREASGPFQFVLAADGRSFSGSGTMPTRPARRIGQAPARRASA